MFTICFLFFPMCRKKMIMKPISGTGICFETLTKMNATIISVLKIDYIYTNIVKRKTFSFELASICKAFFIYLDLPYQFQCC